MRPAESRYSRQIRFAPLGAEGQARIRAASVAIVGCGALGSVQAEAMARAGVGRLRIIDRDFVEWSNLQRQFLFEEVGCRRGSAESRGRGAAFGAREFRSDRGADGGGSHGRPMSRICLKTST